MTARQAACGCGGSLRSARARRRRERWRRRRAAAGSAGAFCSTGCNNTCTERARDCRRGDGMWLGKRGGRASGQVSLFLTAAIRCYCASPAAAAPPRCVGGIAGAEGLVLWQQAGSCVGLTRGRTAAAAQPRSRRSCHGRAQQRARLRAACSQAASPPAWGLLRPCPPTIPSNLRQFFLHTPSPLRAPAQPPR